MPEKDSFELIDEGCEHLYANLISFNTNPEEVCMGLGIRDIRDPDVVNVHSYLHLTIPHFLRFADAVNKQVNLLIERGVISREPEQ
ncbi:MAG: hypothetical protein RB296_08715 [Acidobacteriota bacterium]|jgi:hypothetical protein|nr:hypothetical protein [Acidobacteriota bacterium]